MSNTLFATAHIALLSDADDIPPATATLCRWHSQPRPRPPKPRSFSTTGTGPTARTPTSRRRFTAHYVPSGGEAAGWTARKTLQLSGLGRQPPRRRAPGRAWLGPSARKAPAEPVRRRACDPLQLLRARPP